MRVVVTAPAVSDLMEIEAFISQRDIGAAARVVDRLQERCDSIGDMPNLGTRRDYIHAGLRTVAEGNYLICYRVSSGRVEILRFLHGARDIEKILT